MTTPLCEGWRIVVMYTIIEKYLIVYVYVYTRDDFYGLITILIWHGQMKFPWQKDSESICVPEFGWSSQI